MDELPPIRNLSLTQQRIRDALKNAPPLTITKKSNEDFIVFDNSKKKSDDSLFDRFLKHRTKGSNHCSDSESRKSANKWSQLKDKMEEELETKRMEALKYEEINEKIENEELDGVDEVEDELVKHLDDNIEHKEEEESDSESKQNEGSSADENSDEEIESEVEDNDKELSESEEEKESERQLNPFIDEEAEDDEIDHKLETHSNDSRDSFDLPNHQKERSFIDDSASETSRSLFDESFERKCATQKIALSPFITQKPKPKFNGNNFSELISDFNLNNEEFNSQSIVDLCSGNFIENDNQTDSQTKEESQINCSQDEKSNHDSDLEDNDDEEEEQVLSRTKKVFNIDSDNESETEDKNSYLKTTTQTIVNGSDGEELIVTDEEEAEDESEEEMEDDDNDKEHNVNTFFDDEAELSGSDDVSSDEDDAEDEDQEEEGEQEDLPSDAEIEDQNKRFFNKQILDEEKRNIMIWKEKLFEDGDLHDGGPQRQKKFRWNFDGDDNFVNDYINEDSDDNYMDSDGDETTKTPTLKMSDNNLNFETKTNAKLEKLKSNFKQNFELKNINKTVGSEPKDSSISAFVVRDERLKTIMSIENKRSLNSKNSFKPNKKLKSSKKIKISIFDVLNPIN